ncbi:MAG: glycine cleavage T C-terminal barrel domain-containing protein, partial [Anaerolineales bacterium]
AFYVVPNAGCLEIGGETRIDYLQRQTTNDLSLLSAIRALPNLLTSASGRILEVFTLVTDGDLIGLLTEPGHAPGLADYFKKKIFFNDKVTVQDMSSEWAQIELHGPQAGLILKTLGIDAAPSPDEVKAIEFRGISVRVIGNDSLQNDRSYTVLLPSSALDLLADQLADQGVPPLASEVREILRIEAGKPGSLEFREEYTPFEIGLDRYVSAEKGCYTGQEVLARQVTYDRVVRRLVRLRAERPLQSGASARVEGKTVGQITSAALSPTLGQIALAVLRKPYDSPGNLVEVINNAGKTSAKITLS